MGSSYYSIDEAATRLECTRRSVYNYIKKGILRKSKVKNNAVVLKADVDSYAMDLREGWETNILSRSNFTELQIRVKRLEEFASVVKEMLQLQSDPLRFRSKEEAETVYKAASSMLALKEWSDEQLNSWYSVLYRLDFQSLEDISRAVSGINPWVPFFKLSSNMKRFIESSFQLTPTYKWGKLLQQFELVDKKLRDLAILCVETGTGERPDITLKDLLSSKESIIKRAASIGKN